MLRVERLSVVLFGTLSGCPVRHFSVLGLSRALLLHLRYELSVTVRRAYLL